MLFCVLLYVCFAVWRAVCSDISPSVCVTAGELPAAVNTSYFQTVFKKLHSDTTQHTHTQEEDLWGTLRAPGFILFSPTSAALHCHRPGNMNNCNLLGICDNTWRFREVPQRCCPFYPRKYPSFSLPFGLLLCSSILLLPASFNLLSQSPVNISLSLWFVDSHGHRSVPEQRSRVWGHEGNHNGRKPWRRQQCQRSVWKPDMRVLWVRLPFCTHLPIL